MSPGYFGILGIPLLQGRLCSRRRNIGVYGVIGCRIRWQLRELAVRHALGAQRRDLVWHVLRQGVAIIVPGFCLGLLGSIVLSRLLSSMLYDVPTNDPFTFATVSTGLIGVSLLACWIPARRGRGYGPVGMAPP